MVLGTVIDWTVYRTLDLTVGTLWWVATNTGFGIYNAGCYLAGYNNKPIEQNSKESHKEDLILLKEQNMLLKEQNELLKKQSHVKTLIYKESPF
jgi:hypothetical protein